MPGIWLIKLGNSRSALIVGKLLIPVLQTNIYHERARMALIVICMTTIRLYTSTVECQEFYNDDDDDDVQNQTRRLVNPQAPQEAKILIKMHRSGENFNSLAGGK